MSFTAADYEKFRALRVTHIATRIADLIAEEANDHLTVEQLFLAAVDEALDARRANKIERLIRDARLAIPGASIAEIDYRDGRGLHKARMTRYGQQDWRADPRNVLITSPTGGGKTYLACAIAVAACQNEHTVTYARLDDLGRRLALARADAIAHQSLLNHLANVDLLVIDDFLTVAVDPEAGRDLFAILADRDNRLPTMIASQTGPTHWINMLPDRVAADSIMNRLANHSRKINLGDIDMRQLRNQHDRATPDYWE